MKTIRTALAAITITIAGTTLSAQDSPTVTRRRPGQEPARSNAATAVTPRMQDLYQTTEADPSQLQWMKIIYRELDLRKASNAPLYLPEEAEEGQENLFRIIMRLLADNQLKPYEYLDGREIFTDKYTIPVKDILTRFHIPYTPARGSNDRNPKYNIDESDVPTNEVLSYYIIERWTFDTRQNRLRPTVEAICPILHRAGDFGGEPIRYPMFWINMTDLRPHLALQPIFLDDDNNLPTCTLDDYFTLGRYDGTIYKTRNLQNKTLAQLHPDPDDLRRSQDSIQARLDHFEDNLWTPTRQQLAARAAAATPTASPAETPAAEATAAPAAAPEPRREARRSTRRSRASEAPASRPSTPARSVRRRK